MLSERYMARSIAVTVVTILHAVNVQSENDESNVISNCFIRDYSNIRCTGDFNVSKILLEAREHSDPNDSFWSNRKFRGLEIFNSSIQIIDEKFLQFHGFEFETILIENAPYLRYIHPEALVQLKEHLTDFRAINTSLPHYNDFGNDPHKNENPFNDFRQLREVYIGAQSHCPSDETLIFPCKCEFGELSRSVPSGLWGWSYGLLSVFGRTTHITCEDKHLTGGVLKDIFMNISRSDHLPKHFDVLTIRATLNLTKMPSHVFSNVSLTTIWMDDVTNLKSIHRNAFGSVAKSIQVLDINNANFTSASFSEVDDIFRAFSSLTNIRVLRLGKCGIPYIPSFAFAPQNPQKQLNNLRYLSLSFDRRKHSSGIKYVGSYAFSGAPNLVELGLIRNYIEEFESYAFAFNKTSDRPLTIHIGGNPFNDSYGLKPNAFSGSQRPIRFKFEIDSFQASDPANDPSLHIIPEDVFRPFIEENPKSYFEVDHFNVDIWCDCKSKWMFDDDGNLKESVQNGLRIKRIENNLVGSEPLSIQCKAESSFECLQNCLVFSLAGLIHCGGNNNFDVKSTFRRLNLLNGTKAIDKLVFSSKEIQELPMNAFGTFRFSNIDFTGIYIFLLDYVFIKDSLLSS